MVEAKTKELIALVSLGLVLVFITINLSSIVGFAGKGFDTQEVLQQFFLYSALAIGSLVGIIFAYVYERYTIKGDTFYGNSIFFHTPGEFPSLEYFKKFSALRLFLLSVILFGIAGVLSPLTGQTVFTGVGTLGQQFTEIGSLTYSSLLVPAAENLGLAAGIAFIVTLGIRYFARKYAVTKTNFQGMVYVIVPIFSGIIGVANHLLRYSGSDVSILTVALFWTLGGLITVLTGSFIPFWVMHIMNNLFFDMKNFFSNEITFIYIITFIIISAVIYFLVYGRKNGNIGGSD